MTQEDMIQCDIGRDKHLQFKEESRESTGANEITKAQVGNERSWMLNRA